MTWQGRYAHTPPNLTPRPMGLGQVAPSVAISLALIDLLEITTSTRSRGSTWWRTSTCTEACNEFSNFVVEPLDLGWLWVHVVVLHRVVGWPWVWRHMSVIIWQCRQLVPHRIADTLDSLRCDGLRWGLQLCQQTVYLHHDLRCQ